VCNNVTYKYFVGLKFCSRKNLLNTFDDKNSTAHAMLMMHMDGFCWFEENKN